MANRDGRLTIADKQYVSCEKRCVWLLRGLEQEGQAMVEMALVLPVLLLVVTGILTFGLAFNNYLLLTEATSVGARTLAISRGRNHRSLRHGVFRGVRSRAAARSGKSFLHLCPQRHDLYRRIV